MRGQYERGKGGSIPPQVFPYIEPLDRAEPEVLPTLGWCVICRMHHNTNWHDPLWRQERREAGDRRALTRFTPDRRI